MMVEITIRLESYEQPTGDRRGDDTFHERIKVRGRDTDRGIRLTALGFENMMNHLCAAARTKAEKPSVMWARAYAYSSAGLILATTGVHADAVRDDDE